MDFHLKQWRNQQHESDHHQHQQTPAKIPKLLFEPQQQQQQQQHSSGSAESAAAALPLFVSEPNNSKLSNLSAFPDLTTTTTTPTRFPRMASYFSLAQWQELELQALIFRYMLAGADVPAELLHPIKKSLLISNTPYYLHHSPLHHYPHYQPTLLQPGYWGRGAMDPEPGRCRRTDGKKWRCSRDVVAGHKYCERHMHRGRNRSRKPVEIPTPATTAVGGGNGGGGRGGYGNITPITAQPLTEMSGGSHFTLSGPSSSIDLLQLNQSSSEQITENKSLFQPQNDKLSSGDGRSDGRILRCFFDDWPRSHEDPENASGSNARPMISSTGLSMSIPVNPSSDISLKLSTGTGDDSDSRGRPQLNWTSGWGTPMVAPMGGPLAEALRSSAANSSTSPTSVLHELQKGSASETSYVST